MFKQILFIFSKKVSICDNGTFVPMLHFSPNTWFCCGRPMSFRTFITEFICRYSNSTVKCWQAVFSTTVAAARASAVEVL